MWGYRLLPRGKKIGLTEVGSIGGRHFERARECGLFLVAEKGVSNADGEDLL